jgi:hypothetical protein
VKRLKNIFLVPALFFLMGCVGPLVEIAPVDPETIKSITVYEDKDVLTQEGITILGAVTATSCKHLLWHEDSSMESCTDQLKMKASALSANAIVIGGSEKNSANVLTTKGINRNCWNTVDCSAVAIIKK